MTLRPDIAEEFADATGSGREWFDGEGYSFRRLPKLKDEAFAKLCSKLQQDNWRREHPEKVREFRERAEAKPKRREYRRDWKRRDRDRRWAAKSKAICDWCGREFERKRVGRISKTCSPRCCWNRWYHRRNPDAKRRSAR